MGTTTIHRVCTPGDQIVQTPKGPIRMDAIVRGDKVFAFDPGRGIVATKILKNCFLGVGKFYTIRTLNRKVRVFGDRPVQVMVSTSVGMSYIWIKAKDLRKGDLVVCAQPSTHKSGEDWGIKEARFIGAYLGDGWIRTEKDVHKGHTVGLAIGAADEIHTAQYQTLLGELFPSVAWKNNVKGAFGLTCNSKHVWQRVVDLGISGTSKERSLPKNAFSQSVEVKKALLAGYFDADGTIFTPGFSNEGQGRVLCVNKVLAQNLRELAMSCGMQVSNLREKSVVTNYGESQTWQFCLSASDTAELPLWHSKKKAKLKAKAGRAQGRLIKGLTVPKNVFLQSVLDITEEDVGRIYDITVAHHTHSFVCEGIVLQNCSRDPAVYPL